MISCLITQNLSCRRKDFVPLKCLIFLMYSVNLNTTSQGLAMLIIKPSWEMKQNIFWKDSSAYCADFSWIRNSTTYGYRFSNSSTYGYRYTPWQWSWAVNKDRHSTNSTSLYEKSNGRPGTVSDYPLPQNEETSCLPNILSHESINFVRQKYWTSLEHLWKVWWKGKKQREA